MVIEDVKLGMIALDSFNPRFGENAVLLSQNELISKLLKSKESKELISSMKLGLLWNPYIVIRELDMLKDQVDLADGYKYKCVEGNTRIAILKSNHINSVDLNTFIPVQVLREKDFEGKAELESYVVKIQGRTHVMGVKEWDEVPQARHIYRMAMGYYVLTGSTLENIYKKIAQELALDFSKVRDMVTRYKIFSHIAEITDELSEGEWGYLEAVDRTKKIREFFGMVESDLKFEWEFDEKDFLVSPYEEHDMKKEFLINFPKLIKLIKNDVNTKVFRDTITKLIASKNNEFELVKLAIDEVINDEKTWSTLVQEANGDEPVEKIKDEWKKKLGRMKNELNTLPVAADWIGECRTDIKDIRDKVQRIIKMLDS
ncbi:hypothetical protein [Sporosarcina sp. G11-34]|uniref:hypothetical protein n=1 Tax=Sporosarcina sp. G11-34 TaxID=2849605 RepID=UPI0022A9CADC|nr:hypothetical protein [Sporosarcina sp. G11-34]MCZ2259859.1 hypothetical protein [Sporosarcina sp. G11-34]